MGCCWSFLLRLDLRDVRLPCDLVLLELLLRLDLRNVRSPLGSVLLEHPFESSSFGIAGASFRDWF